MEPGLAKFIAQVQCVQGLAQGVTVMLGRQA